MQEGRGNQNLRLKETKEILLKYYLVFLMEKVPDPLFLL